MSDKSASQVGSGFSNLLSCESRNFYVNRLLSGDFIYYSLMVNFGKYSIADTSYRVPWVLKMDEAAIDEMLAKLKKEYMTSLSESMRSK